MSEKRVAIVAGGGGVIGEALVRHLEQRDGWDVVALSRRKPSRAGRARHVAVDLCDREATQARALAQAALFTNQIPAFQAAPSVYVERAYLRTFTRATANARKYIMLTTNTHDVLIFDLQDRIRPELLENLNVSTNKPTK